MRLCLDLVQIKGFSLLVVIVLCAQLGTAVYKCDFESDGCFCPWMTTKLNGFDLVRAGDYKMPQVDASGSIKGHYVLADGLKGNDIETHHMHSQCYVSNSASCTLQISYMMYPPKTDVKNDFSQLTVDLFVGCQHNIEGHIETVSKSNIHGNPYQRWQTINITIGKYPDGFRVFLSGYVPTNLSFIAVDELEFFNCEPDRPVDGACKADEFRCSSSQCISRDKVCNIENDCACGEDEFSPQCKKIPFYGQCTFEDCNFPSNDCGWYNVEDDDFDWLLKINTSEAMDHTTKAGHCLSVNREESPGIHSTAVLRSVQLDPQPDSGLCTLRFFIQMEYGSFEMDVEALEVKGHRQKQVLWQSSKHLKKKKKWQFVAVPIKNITGSYVLQFRAYQPKGHILTNVYLDDISLSIECFQFTQQTDITTCSAKGRIGPTPDQCHATYSGTQAEDVSVVTEGEFTGAQIWVVPESATYSITATGASGGIGINSRSWEAAGGYAHAKFYLEKGEKIYFVVGQKGESSSCDQQTDILRDECIKQQTNQSTGGGGAGGGGTFVFMVNISGDPIILLVAGGGGGLGATFRGKDKSTLGGLSQIKDGESGFTSLNTSSGGGAGWAGQAGSPQTGRSLLEGMFGGRSCDLLARQVDGGFGGGGGACIAGGGGGGYSGGDAPDINSPLLNGKGGSSFINSDSTDDIMEIGHTSESDGFVQILPQHGCVCDNICVWTDYKANKFNCHCFSPDKVLANNGINCILRSKDSQSGFIIAIVTSSTVIVLLLGSIAVCLCGRRYSYFKKCHPGIISLNKIVSYCQAKHMQSGHRVRQSTQPPTSVMEFNPNYDYGGAKHLDQNLLQVPRKHVKLIRPLGRGAFGEVCEGTLGSANSSVEEVRIAVKTLLPLCTEQTEVDFLMEAIIVSKFHHPNIVKFLGVCFEQRPRYIILELLEGGDLKSFLRESRPKPGEPSNLTVADLLRLALDVSRGCQHLEEKHFIHRDIAARNCLLTTKKSNRMAKIADFGMARDIYRSDYYRKSGNALLPVKWMPPEAFLDGIFTSKTDIWSFGVLLWEVFSLGYMPYPGCSNEEVVHFVAVGGRLDAPDSCPSSVYDIMASCWSGIAEERPPFSLVVSSLENCLQDQDLSSNLPIIFLPTVSAARSFKVPQSIKSSSASGNGSKRQSEGCLEPLLPSWLTEDQAEGGPVNDEDLSEEESTLLRRAKYDRDFSDYGSKRDSPKKSPTVQLHIPPSELPLLTVADFQELFDNEHPKQSESSSRSHRTES